MSLISIIMPYYKKKNYIKDAINSITNQSYQNFEIILIDDEVNNESSKFLNEISKLDKRIRLISNKKNLGAGETRNKGISISNGDYIAFCDCDDLWNESKLLTQLDFIKKLNLSFSFTAYEIIDSNNKKIGFRKAPKIINFDMLRKSCDIGLSTVMIDRKIFDNEKFKFAELKTKEDYVLWMLLAKKGIKMMGIDQNLVSWRKDNNSLSSSTFQKLIDGYKVYRVYFGYSKLKSLYNLAILSVNFILKKIK